jgi:hypothetical protein
VDLIKLPPHTSDRTKPLDLLFFSIFKDRFSRTNVTCFADKQSNDVCKMTRALSTAAAMDPIVQSFELAGLIPSFEEGDGVIFQVNLELSQHLKNITSHPKYAEIFPGHLSLSIEQGYLPKQPLRVQIETETTAYPVAASPACSTKKKTISQERPSTNRVALLMKPSWSSSLYPPTESKKTSTGGISQTEAVTTKKEETQSSKKTNEPKTKIASFFMKAPGNWTRNPKE